MKKIKMYTIIFFNILLLSGLVFGYFYYRGNLPDKEIKNAGVIETGDVLGSNSGLVLVDSGIIDDTNSGGSGVELTTNGGIIYANELDDDCKTKTKSKEFIKIYNNYLHYKDMYISNKFEKEYNKEYIAIKAFAQKDCSVIDKSVDLYTFDLCNIYLSGDYSKLDSFKFLEGENKKETILFYESIKSNTVSDKLSENYKELVKSVNNFNRSKKTVDFRLNEEILKFRGDIYAYYVENGKDKFLLQLDDSLKTECKKL